jgi:chromosome segregation ATPase
VGSSPTSGTQVIHTLTPMGQRLLHRKLAQTSSRLRELEEELRVVEDQMSQLVEETDELSLRALVSETPAAEFEYREAKKHSDAMVKHRDGIVAEIAELTSKINDLLDKLKDSNS